MTYIVHQMASDSQLETLGMARSPAEHDSLVTGAEDEDENGPVTKQQLGVFRRILDKLGMQLDSDQTVRYEQLELVAVDEDEEEEVC